MRGKKLLTNLICAFIPSKLIRERLKLRASDNQILIIDNGKERKMKLRELKNLKFNFLGESAKNIIKIHKNSKIKGVINVFANNNEIFFGENVTGNYMISTTENSKLVISDGCAANGLNINLFTPSECIIGKDCLFSWNVNIFPSDGHAIYDKKTNKLLNSKSTLKIGNHCWIGYGSTITKNAYLPDNTIVGASSVVCKKFKDKYTVIAGNPAKVVKEGIRFER